MKKILYILIPLLALSGCRRDDNTQQETQGIALAPQIVEQMPAEQVATRATASRETAFATGDIFGVYVVPFQTTGATAAEDMHNPLLPSGNYADNATYKVGTGFTPVVNFPNLLTKLDLYAVYPQMVLTSTTQQEFTVKPDQSAVSGNDFRASDLMTAQAKGVTPKGAAAVLNFAHRLSKLTVGFTLPATYQGLTVTGVTSVRILGTKPTVNFDLSNVANKVGVNAASAVTPILALKDPASSGKNYIYEAIVVPQQLPQSTPFVEINITTNDGGTHPMQYALTGAFDIQEGNNHALTFTFLDDMTLKLSGSTITNWSDNTLEGMNGTPQGAVNKFTTTTALTGITTVKVSCSDGYIYEVPATIKDGVLAFELKGSEGKTPERYPYVVRTIEFMAGEESKGVVNYDSQPVTAPGEMVLTPNVIAANSYKIAPGESVTFGAFKAGNDRDGMSSYSANLATNVKSVKILWQTRQGHTNDADPMVLEDNGVAYDATSKTVTVTARANGLGGNAVVAAYDATTGGNILWSWHIWVLPESEVIAGHNYGTAFVTANGTGKTIMDRNLGALSALPTSSLQLTGGLMYQWGRKDPFTGSVGDVVDLTKPVQVYDASGVALSGTLGGFTFDGTAAPILKSVQNPTTHYYNSATQDWCTENDKFRWTSTPLCNSPLDEYNRGPKALYDPCPAGYRVPTGTNKFDPAQGTWGDFNTSGNTYWQGSDVTAGSLFTQGGQSWYPASGQRNSNSGILSDITTGGNYWSSSVLSYRYDAYRFFFYEPNVFSAISAHYAFGYPVRCVQE